MLAREPFRTRRAYAAALALDSIAPLVRAAGRARARRGPTPASSWRAGLILGDPRIGDVLYRTASLPHLARGLPACRWTYIASPAGAEVLRGNPCVAEIVTFDDHRGTWGNRRTLYDRLRERDFDVVICTNAVGYAADLVLGAALRIPNRAALTHKGLAGLVTWPVAARFPSPTPAYVRDIVASVTGLQPDWSLVPKLHPDEGDRNLAQAEYERLGLGPQPVIACAPATRESVGGWGAETFAQLAAAVAVGFDVVLCGSRSDEPLLRRVSAQAGVEPRIAAGTLNVRALGEFFRLCAGVIAQDSGPRHVANAVGTPVAFFRNLAVHPVETGKYCENEVDLAPPTARPLDAKAAQAIITSTSPEEAAERFLEFIGLRQASQ